MFSNNLALNLKRVIELSNDILLVIEKQSIGKQSVRNVSDFFKNKYVEYTQAFGPLQEYL